jgi:hypothetical protein
VLKLWCYENIAFVFVFVTQIVTLPRDADVGEIEADFEWKQELLF